MTTEIRRRGHRCLRRAAVAGILGTVAESALMEVGVRLGRRRPVFLPSGMVQTMAGHFGHRVGDGSARLLGNAMRAGYGPAWAVVWTWVGPVPISRPLRNAGLLGLVIWGFELAVLPLVRATPPLSQWPRIDVVWDLTNALAFACAYAFVLSSMSQAPAGGRDARP